MGWTGCYTEDQQECGDIYMDLPLKFPEIVVDDPASNGTRYVPPY